MNRTTRLVLFLLVLAAITGYLFSKASLAGRAGITFFYKQYSFLKVWWQAGLLIFFIWIIIFFVQRRIQQKLSPKTSKRIQLGSIGIALLGLYFTYQDFRHSLSHRWLGERFHLGGYLFWIGWIIICVFYLTEKQKTTLPGDTIPGKEIEPV